VQLTLTVLEDGDKCLASSTVLNQDGFFFKKRTLISWEPAASGKGVRRGGGILVPTRNSFPAKVLFFAGFFEPTFSDARFLFNHHPGVLTADSDNYCY